MALLFSKVAKAAEELLVTPNVLGEGIEVFHDPAYAFTKTEYKSFIGAWDTLSKKFPQVAKTISKINIGGEPEELRYWKASALTGEGPSLEDRELAKRYAADPAKLKEVSTSAMHFNVPMMRQAATSTNGVDPTFGGILTHEFGHALQNAGFASTATEAKTSFKEGKFNLLYRLIYQAGDPLPPSEYGTVNPAEHFAESFTQVVRKRKTDPLINAWNEIAPNYRVSSADTGLRRKDHQGRMLQTRRMFGFK